MTYTLHQIQKVKNRSVLVHLPENFPLSDQVEVIILPVIPEDDSSIQNFLKIDTSHFTASQMRAYERTVDLIREGRQPEDLRILGLFAGLVEISDDFNAPLPDEDLYWGEETGAEGVHLNK